MSNFSFYRTYQDLAKYHGGIGNEVGPSLGARRAFAAAATEIRDPHLANYSAMRS